MKITMIQKLRMEGKGINKLVTEIKDRMDGGHYDYMSWKGRTHLREKIDEYDRYANESYRASSTMNLRDTTQRKMMVELRSILKSTY
jgi:hypothetical protein